MEAKGRPVTQQESGFVVQDLSGGQPVYYSAHAENAGGTFTFSPDIDKALRFARKLDGERFIVRHLSYAVGNLTVVPHVKQ